MGIFIKRKIEAVIYILAAGMLMLLSLGICKIMTEVSREGCNYWETKKLDWLFDRNFGSWQTYDENEGVATGTEKNDIRWIDFTPTKEALQVAYEWDKETWSEQIHIDWIALLAYGAVKGGGEYNKKAIKAMDDYANAVRCGEKTMEELEKLEYYTYYYEILSAVLDGMVGSYRIEVPKSDGSVTWQECYGLKAFSPIAKGFSYEHYDDFGAGRSYGYERKHLGHDMMGQVGTPIIAVESGYVEAIGWNQYGGWRIGIRSLDKKRYYYYAHMRQDYPYAENLKEGDFVTAGDVIGYMGHTGYSVSENVNNIDTVHLHLGIEIIMDEEQRADGNEIWIDCFELTKFLYINQSAVRKEEEGREWKRIYDMEDPVLNSTIVSP